MTSLNPVYVFAVYMLGYIFCAYDKLLVLDSALLLLLIYHAEVILL